MTKARGRKITEGERQATRGQRGRTSTEKQEKFKKKKQEKQKYFQGEKAAKKLGFFFAGEKKLGIFRSIHGQVCFARESSNKRRRSRGGRGGEEAFRAKVQAD